MKTLRNSGMRASLRKTAVLAAAVASLSFAGTSWATPETGTIHFSSKSNEGAVSGLTLHQSGSPDKSSIIATKFAMNVEVGGTNAYPQYQDWVNGSTFDAFCIDINHTIGMPGTYDVSGLTAGPTGLGFNLSALQVAQINKLLDLYLDTSFNTGMTYRDAGMQMALWEVVNETGSPLNVNGGPSFFITGNGVVGSDARNDANTFLGELTSINASYTSNDYDLLLLKSISPTGAVTNQGLIGWCTKGDCDPSVPPQEISEPGTLLLLSAGLGMVFFSTRRRLAV